MKTYGDIYNEFCDKFPNAKVEDYKALIKDTEKDNKALDNIKNTWKD